MIKQNLGSYGTIIAGKYKLLNKINQGSFGEIYTACNLHNNETVAVKIVSQIFETKMKCLSFIGFSAFENEFITYRSKDFKRIIRARYTS